MTATQYRAAKRKGSSFTARQVQAKLRKARAAYAQAVKRMNAVIGRLPGGRLSVDSRERIIKAFNRESVYDELVVLLDDGRAAVIDDAFSVDREYVEEAFRDAGKAVDLTELIERLSSRVVGAYKIRNSAATALPLVQNRASYSLSSSVWDAVDGFSAKILNVVEAELAAGTDPAKVARVIELYLVGGADVILGRWNSLKIGTTEYRKRLGTKGADYRTQRVVRTELYNARRDADIQAGKMNPGSTGMFTWNLSAFHNSCDICEGRASGGEYTAEQIQSLTDDTHPNCGCYAQPVLKDREEFVQSLRDYVDGKETPGADEIDQWATMYGLVA